MKLGIATDSTADLSADLVERYAIQIVPTILILDGKEYKDGIGISREEFYKRLPSFQKPPTTAAPSIEDFVAAYRRLLDAGCERVLSIHISEKLSGVVNAARRAAQEFPNQIIVVDSGSLSMGIGFQVLAAAEAADLGMDAALAALKDTQRRSKVFAALNTMEYLRRSGRVSGAVAALGGALSIKPIVELRDGDVKPMAIKRTMRQSDDFMLTKLLEMGEMELLSILHTNAEDRASRLIKGAMERARMSVPRNVALVNVTAVIGTHLGPDCLGFAAVRKR